MNLTQTGVQSLVLSHRDLFLGLYYSVYISNIDDYRNKIIVKFADYTKISDSTVFGHNDRASRGT